MSIGTFEPPLTEIGSPIDFGTPSFLAEGVTGYAVQNGNEIRILEIEGNGTDRVGAFLDSLSPKCCIVNVINERLRGMLMRRGWSPAIEGDEAVDVWRKKSAK